MILREIMMIVWKVMIETDDVLWEILILNWNRWFLYVKCSENWWFSFEKWCVCFLLILEWWFMNAIRNTPWMSKKRDMAETAAYKGTGNWSNAHFAWLAGSVPPVENYPGVLLTIFEIRMWDLPLVSCGWICVLWRACTHRAGFFQGRPYVCERILNAS